MLIVCVCGGGRVRVYARVGGGCVGVWVCGYMCVRVCMYMCVRVCVRARHFQ